MADPVWWCPECDFLEPGLTAFGVAERHPAECPGTPIDLIAEREEHASIVEQIQAVSDEWRRLYSEQFDKCKRLMADPDR